MFGAKVIRSLGSIMEAIQTANSTLSATPLLVSLIQGDNSFYIFLSGPKGAVRSHSTACDVGTFRYPKESRRALPQSDGGVTFNN